MIKYVSQKEMYMKTTIYLIKHADELKENGIKNVKDNTQLMNEKVHFISKR